jgi:hypothetical protein
MPLLLTDSDLPDGFTYPKSFIRVAELGLIDLEPWAVLVGDSLFKKFNGLQSRYPDRKYVPFAQRVDNDDVACWDSASDSMVVLIVHDFASPGWEQRRRPPFSDFNAWLRQAIEDLIEFGSFEETGA